MTQMSLPASLRSTQRFNQLRAFDLTEKRARDLARVLADETLASWQRFKSVGKAAQQAP